jgi:MFS family permease
MAGSVAATRSDTIFYGWYIVGASAVVIFTSAGIGFYGLPVFLDPLNELKGFSKPTISLAMTLYFAVSGLVAVPAGWLVDRKGPRPTLIIGAVVMTGALLLLGHITQTWQLFAVYFLMASAFALMGAVSVNALITRWFIKKRARALSLSMTGVSLAGVILVPVFTQVIRHWGFTEATTVLAAMVAIGVIPITVLVLKDRPEDMGLLPDGARDRSELDMGGVLSYSAQTRVWTPRAAIHTRAFWAIALGFTFIFIGQTGYLMHQISFLREEIGTSAAALAVSVTAGASICGRLAVGSFADRLDKRLVAVVCFMLQGLAMLVVIAAGNIVTIYIGTMIVGLTIGNVYMMQSLLVGEAFGMTSFGAVFGMMALLSQTVSSIGPAMVGILEDASGGYELPFLITAALSWVAAAIISQAKPPRDAAPEPAP